MKGFNAVEQRYREKRISLREVVLTQDRGLNKYKYFSPGVPQWWINQASTLVEMADGVTVLLDAHAQWMTGKEMGS